MNVASTIVWSKPNCPHCVEAKRMLTMKQIPYEERLIGNQWTREQLLEELPYARTVPQIILHGSYVGGLTELKHYFENHNMWLSE